MYHLCLVIFTDDGTTFGPLVGLGKVGVIELL
jgi:hypothetical protein